MTSHLYIGPDSEPDKYRLVRSVGRGGEATLYLAEVSLAGQTEPVVVKSLNSDVTANDEEFAELSAKWSEQAELLRFINRLGVVGVREHFEGAPEHPRDGAGEHTERALYLVMNHVEGMDLRDWRAEHAAEGPRGLREALRCLEQVAEVLDVLHSGRATPSKRVVVHGDLSPGNIMISDEGQATLVDFGLSRIAARHMTARPWFTPGYAAPEIFQGEYSADTDRYAFGAVTYFALSGEDPPPSPEQLRERFAALPVLEGAGERQRTHVLSMFAAEPDQRPEASEWIRALRSLGTSVPWTGPTDEPGSAAGPDAPGQPGGAAAAAAVPQGALPQEGPPQGERVSGPPPASAPVPGPTAENAAEGRAEAPEHPSESASGAGQPPDPQQPPQGPSGPVPGAPPPGGPPPSTPPPGGPGQAGAPPGGPRPPHPQRPAGPPRTGPPQSGPAQSGPAQAGPPPGGPHPVGPPPSGPVPPGHAPGGPPPTGAQPVAAFAAGQEPPADPANTAQESRKSRRPLLVGIAVVAVICLVAGSALTYVVMDRVLPETGAADANPEDAGVVTEPPTEEATEAEETEEPEPTPTDEATEDPDTSPSPEEDEDVEDGEALLTQLEPVDVDHHAWSAETGRSEMDGEVYSSGIITESCLSGCEGWSEYNLSRDWDTFTATIGVDDESASDPTVTFTVLVDGESEMVETLRLGETSDIEVSVADALRMRIEVEGDGSDMYPVWADPTLTEA